VTDLRLLDQSNCSCGTFGRQKPHALVSKYACLLRDETYWRRWRRGTVDPEGVVNDFFDEKASTMLDPRI